jgi:hypothetical protein
MPTSYFPFQGSRATDLLLYAGFESVNLGSSGNHDNHYTTDNDYIEV